MGFLKQGYGLEGVFCGVFDGHGRNGHTVSRMVRDYLPSLLLNKHSSLFLSGAADEALRQRRGGIDEPDKTPELFNEWSEACVAAFKAMDKELNLISGLDCSYSGTTAVTVVKQGKDLIIANLGDSRAVMGTVSDDGRLRAVQLTTDLKPSLPQEAERIRRSNGRIFALRDEPRIQRVWLPNEDLPGLAMARSLGDFKLKNYGVISVPQVAYRRISGGDKFIVLATDGVWDVLSNERVASIVWSAARKEEAGKEVVAAAVRAWRYRFPAAKVDDCTALCFFLQ